MMHHDSGSACESGSPRTLRDLQPAEHRAPDRRESAHRSADMAGVHDPAVRVLCCRVSDVLRCDWDIRSMKTSLLALAVMCAFASPISRGQSQEFISGPPDEENGWK